MCIRDRNGDVLFASDYFPQMYEAAIRLIKNGKAYVDDLSADEIRQYRGTLTEPGKESPYRNRSVEENLQLFEEMKEGKYADGSDSLFGLLFSFSLIYMFYKHAFWLYL